MTGLVDVDSLRQTPIGLQISSTSFLSQHTIDGSNHMALQPMLIDLSIIKRGENDFMINTGYTDSPFRTVNGSIFIAMKPIFSDQLLRQNLYFKCPIKAPIKLLFEL